MIPEFPDADFYDCRDAERLSHETPEEAIDEYLDCFAEHGSDIFSDIRKATPLTVVAYRRVKPADQWIQRMARRILGDISECWDEEFGDPDGLRLSPVAKSWSFPAAVELVLAFIEQGMPRVYEPIGEVTLSAEQVEEMMRKSRPEWFAEVAP